MHLPENMSSLNKWLGLGNLVADPKREMFGRDPVATFTMAIGERWKGNERQQGSTMYLPVVARGKLGEHVMEYLTKGRQVLVEGRLQIHAYEDQHQGKHHRASVEADSIQFLGTKDGRELEPLPDR